MKYVTIIGALLGILITLTTLIKLLWPVARKWSLIADVLTGEPEQRLNGKVIRARTPSLPEQLQALTAGQVAITGRVDNVDAGQAHMIGQLGTLSTRLAVVEHEMVPNSGGSIKDQVATIAQVVTAQSQGGTS